MAPPVRDEFVNESGGWIGVVTITARGDREAIAVPPGHSVWLSEEEQIETANAPRAEGDNPLVNGQLVLRTSAAEVKHRRPLRPDPAGPVAPVTPADAPQNVEDLEPDEPDTEETGTTPAPDGEPEEGEFAPGEEVATPAAAEAPKPRRRRATAGAVKE